MAAAAAAVALTAIWLYIVGVSALESAWLQLKKGRKQGGELARLVMAEPFTRLLERLRVFDALQLTLSGYHVKLLILNDGGWTIERTKEEAGASLGKGYAALTACAWLSLLGGEPLLLAMGLLFGVLLAVRPVVEAGRRVERRKRQLITELPEMLSKLMLLVGAGETVQQALARCLEGKDAKHPLYKEWGDAVSSLRNGQSFSEAMERFNRRCAVQEVSIFTTVLLLNYRRGGEHFALALRELSYTLWEKRKAIARSRGEEASSKLVFPLVGILLVLMVLVAAPAVLLMT
ncbi:type II secretion system F family protein [Paenibacillus arenilitoris]|uniref:Type II secretion system F family protein n=1 Tax=Paenibacillus arenilitoris TaxID=2772299 RepID=A0A927CLE0_9BACL|nr:type II secretion system F family protein [Paenibacillus arenilitoris]MBD2867775.1 type II secretion system F family protein [Paenibacillus arenilitoris]